MYILAPDLEILIHYTEIKGCYGVSITGNIRLIVKPDVGGVDPATLMKCDSVIIKGVVDYHGKKQEWLIP